VVKAIAILAGLVDGYKSDIDSMFRAHAISNVFAGSTNSPQVEPARVKDTIGSKAAFKPTFISPKLRNTKI
jgi:hypothetical protein